MKNISFRGRSALVVDDDDSVFSAVLSLCPMSPDHAAVLHDHGIVVLAGVIFGFDDDDPGVFDRTREFLLDCRVGHGSFSALTPFPGTRIFAELQAQSRITTYDWSKYDGITSVFVPKLMSPQQLQDGTRQMGVNFYSTANILRRLWVNRRHPLIYLGTSFAYRHTCRSENGVRFLERSGSWKKRPEVLAIADVQEAVEPSLLVPADQVRPPPRLWAR